MASISAIAARRGRVTDKLVNLPGAVVRGEAANTKDQIELSTSGVNVTAHDILLSNTQLLEFLDRVLTPLVARVEALEAVAAHSLDGTGKGKK